MEDAHTILDPSSPSATAAVPPGSEAVVQAVVEPLVAIPLGVSRPAVRAIGPSAVSRLSALLITLLALWLVGPYFAEHMEYAIVRGRQRAEAEVASAMLRNASLESLSHQYQMVSKRVGPSVVHINVTTNVPSVPGDETAWHYRWEAGGQGSGVIVDSNGFILTNLHVVQGATDIQVGLSEGRRLKGEIVGSDPLTDLAILRVHATNLLAAEWGDSDKLDVGALVWAVGSPLGLQRSVTCGILSAKNRAGVAGRVYQNLLQTDAAVNPGNSGGPLVDAQGRVVGINTAIMGDAFQGISFAIPSSVARRVYERLKNQGHVDRGWLGVGLGDVTDEVAARLQLKSPLGARILAVCADPTQPSPAQRAGIQADDVIIGWNGIPITDPASLSLNVAQTDVGSTADAVVMRRGQQLQLRIVVGRRPDKLD